jgi:hypothetical protein
MLHTVSDSEVSALERGLAVVLVECPLQHDDSLSIDEQILIDD